MRWGSSGRRGDGRAHLPSAARSSWSRGHDPDPRRRERPNRIEPNRGEGSELAPATGQARERRQDGTALSPVLMQSSPLKLGP